MTVLRMEHVGIVVDDLPAAVAFFLTLGLRVEGETSVAGEEVDRIIGLPGAASDIAILVTPDGHGKVELTRFRAPAPPPGDAFAPSHAPGLRHLLFAVDDVHATLARLRAEHGTELVGEVVDFGGSWRLCYLRGPAGIIVELAEKLG